MDNQQNSGDSSQSDDRKNRKFNSVRQRTEGGDEPGNVHIQPSEPNTVSADRNEEEAPGRTPGKAEGSIETAEENSSGK